MYPNELTTDNILSISKGVCCPYYCNDIKATHMMVSVIADVVRPEVLNNADDYVRAYDDNFFTYKTWRDLVESEKEQGTYGLTENELKAMLGSIIHQLENGWYMQQI